MEGRLPGRRRRTPEACVTCRRRKTKCDGIRPRCRHCASRGIQCIWPGPDPEASNQTPPSESPASTITTATSEAPRGLEVQLPEHRIMRRCFDVFFEYHSANTFCSFLYRPDLDDESLREPFLFTAMLCLCARHFTKEEAKEDFGLATGLEVCRVYAPRARALARLSSDEPSIRNIQGNLILAVSEFMDNEGSSHWMYAGTAIRMAQIMRLNMEYHSKHSIKEREIRRRTFWACVIVDNWLAYFLTKPPSISPLNIMTSLPGTDASFVFQEPTRGLTLVTISAFTGYQSDIGILPYLMKTACLWGEIVFITVRNHRFMYRTLPTDPASPFYQTHQSMREWEAGLSPSLQWSEQNYANHSSLGHGKAFVAMHFLMRSSFCTAHQSYLPQLDNASILGDTIDGAGWSLLHREPGLIETCVENALATGRMAEYLWDGSRKMRSELDTIHVAASLYSVANTLLWLQHAHDPQYPSSTSCEEAGKLFTLILTILSSWTEHWPCGKQWLNALRAIQAMYRAAYLGEITEPEISDLSTGTDELGARFRPRPGDGFPSFDFVPNLYDSLRLLASDSSAEPRLIRSIWMQFSLGWPRDLVGDGDIGFGEFG